jgi:MFS family permease
VPIMKSFDHPQMVAASIAGLAGISTIVGRIVGGYLLDRISGNFVAGCSVAMPLLSVGLLLAFPTSVPACAAAALILGLGLGAELDAEAYLTTRHFGMKSFGVLFGVVGGTLGLATGLGPTILSHIYDVYHSYVPALWAYIPICIAGSALFFTLGRYPDFGEAGLPSDQPKEGAPGTGLAEPAPAAR